MKAQESWRPSKYRFKKGRLRASRDKNEVAVGSRLVSDITARFYQDKIASYAHGRLADLGCGKVPLYEAYTNHVHDVTCVDWQSPAGATSHLDVECDLGKKLPFEDSSFDTVVLSDVLEHIADPKHLWAELHRLIKPGGKLLMNTPFMYCLHEQPHDYFRFTSHSLRHFAKSHGFFVDFLEPLGGTPEVLADITAKHLQFIPLIGPPLSALLQRMAFWMTSGGFGKRWSARTAAAFPISYGMVATRR